MTEEGIVQKVFRNHERYFGQDYDLDKERLQKKLIEAIKQTLDYKSDNENTVTYYILKLLIGDAQK